MMVLNTKQHKFVKLFAIYIFIALDLDVYIAARTALNKSFCNTADSEYTESWPSECFTAREAMEPAKEIKMKSLGTLKKIREPAKRDPSLGENLEAFIKPVLDLISNCFSQLKSSGNLLHIEARTYQDDSKASFVDLFSSMFPVGDEAVEQSFASISEGTITNFQGFHGKPL